MGVMTAQQVLPMTMVPGVVRVGAAADLVEDSGGRAVTPATSELDAGDAGDAQGGDAQVLARVADLPVLAVPAARTTDRVAARWHGIECAGPVFTPAAQVRLAGLFLALPALEATGLLTCAKEVYTRLPAGFYGLDTMLVEGVLRALAGEPRDAWWWAIAACSLPAAPARASWAILRRMVLTSGARSRPSTRPR